MSRRLSIRTRTWTALALPQATWFAFEQGLSAPLHADCTRWPIGLAWGVASLAVCGLSLWLAWPLRGHQGVLVHPWLVRMAMALSGFFGLAIAFQTLAVAIVPACVG